MAILVTGGAGYIGSVAVELLRQQGEDVVVLDDLSRGNQAAVDPDLPFYEGNVGNRKLIGQIAADHDLEACLHFAAYAYVGESVQDPAKYYANNLEMGLGLLDGLLAVGVKKVVFSSSCTTYGEPQYTPIDEAHPQHPTNPYGWTKYFMERIMADYDRAYGLKSVSLRYFNVCCAIPTRGEVHDPETHIIPLILQVALGQRPYFQVYGGDYPTLDGTAVRDYVHVADLASAHIQALEYLRQYKRSDFFNLGNEAGYSVLEVIEAAREVTGHPIPIKIEARRPGDPSRLVADARKAASVLHWQVRYVALTDIIQTAWDWQQRHPKGYNSAP
jgi:UDP-glucose 4-epimerase